MAFTISRRRHRIAVDGNIRHHSNSNVVAITTQMLLQPGDGITMAYSGRYADHVLNERVNHETTLTSMILALAASL